MRPASSTEPGLEKDHAMDRFRIALAQLAPVLFDKEKNLQKAEDAIRQAAAGGAAAIIFPELYLTGYSLGDRAVEMAERPDGPCGRRVCEMAARYRIAVLMGYAELHPDGQRAFDAVLVVDSIGKACGSYRKIHLFHAETEWFAAGETEMVVDFGLGPTGILICYDLEFPEAVRSLALRGAQWVATSTGNMVPNQHLQEVYVQARAAENRLWVAVANRVGREDGIEFFGGSAVADPHGNLTGQASADETVLFSEIELKRAAEARQNADYLADRRPEIYAGALKP
jgi:nitrilase